MDRKAKRAWARLQAELSEGTVTDALPERVLSVRQPWAWAIIHAGKDIENRAWQRRRQLEWRGRVAIHTARGMTRREYEDARRFIEALGVVCAMPAELARGGIIGSVEVADDVAESDSPWFTGPRGLVLRNPRPCAFLPVDGQLGHFPVAWQGRQCTWAGEQLGTASRWTARSR
jgi:hypothetical protein